MIVKIVAATSLLCCALFSFAETVVVSQKNKQFIVGGKEPPASGVHELQVKKGDVIRFENDDKYFHNIFSLSDTKVFDLGSFPKGEHRDVTMDKAGKVEVECAIHPEMKIILDVK